MKIIVSLFALLCCLACSNRNSLPKPFSAEMLATQLFNVNTGADTSLQTLHGSIIRIASGSFNVNGIVEIEIKEALTSAEILAAGLATESNGRPLRSGGMIFINATAKGEKAELLKPIKVSIPNQFYDPSMQIFKGIETDSAGINWVDPSKPDTTEQSAQWLNGKNLFMSKCASCHNIFKPTTGPALKDVEYRGPWTDRQNLYSYIRNPAAFMITNKYTWNLKEQYGSMMVSYPDLSNQAIDAILDFIKNESNNPLALYENDVPINTTSAQLGSFEMPDTNSLSDYSEKIQRPCKDDTIYQPIPRAEQSFFGNGSITSPTPAIPITAPISSNDTPPKSSPAKAEDLEGLRGGFNDSNPTGGMYDFEIRTLGWYNVDAYVEGYNGSSNVKLYVQLQIELDLSMHVYLFCPRNKMLSVMNDKRGDKFFFNKINDGIPLFLNDRAILFAFGSKDDKIYYGISEFRVQGEQTINVKVKESSENEIRKALLAKQLEGIDLGIEKKDQKIIKKECDDYPVAATDSLKSQ